MKKKIVIFTSTGGNGHTAVSTALKDVLSPMYDVSVLNIFSDVLRPLDYIQRITRNRATGESLYNYLLKNQWIRILNMFKTIGKLLYTTGRARSTRYIEQRLRAEHADLVISVVPFVNGAVACAAKNIEIPFLMIPTDFDATTFLYGLRQCDMPKSFRVALACDDPRVYAPFDTCGISRSQIVLTGFVLRPGFYQHHDVLTIKHKYAITDDRPVVLMMLGSQGSQGLYTITQQLLTLTVPAHIMVLVGRNSALIEQLQALSVPTNLTLHVLGFTDDIASLMAIADVLITKSGSVSVAEGLQIRVPMLLDATTVLLGWEKLNHTLLKEYGIGDSITNSRQVPSMVRELIANPERAVGMRQAAAQFAQHNGAQQVKKLVAQMLGSD